MTDGIIQEVFTTWIKKHPSISNTGIHELEAIQHELIEKIKQEFPNHLHKRYIKKIIGDNKE